MDLYGRSLLKETDLNADEFRYLVDLAGHCGRKSAEGVTGQRLAGRNIALIFEKTSTRTRSAFEVAAHDEGGARHLPRPGGNPARPQGVGEGHRPGPRPHVRRHRIPRIRPGIHRDPRRVRRGAGLERAHRHLAPDPDAGRHLDHERPFQQTAGRDVLLLPGGRPEQHGELAAGDRGHARHGRPHLRPRQRCSPRPRYAASPPAWPPDRAPGSW